MAHETPVYDLTLLLSTAAPDETRAKILSDLEAAIQRGGGSVVGRSDWGARNLAYRIERQNDADFHLLQITGPSTLLTDLGHTLRITDGVLRFRIIKAVPGSRLGAAAAERSTVSASSARDASAASAPPGARAPREAPPTPAREATPAPVSDEGTPPPAAAEATSAPAPEADES